MRWLVPELSISELRARFRLFFLHFQHFQCICPMDIVHSSCSNSNSSISSTRIIIMVNINMRITLNEFRIDLFALQCSQRLVENDNE